MGKKPHISLLAHETCYWDRGSHSPTKAGRFYQRDIGSSYWIGNFLRLPEGPFYTTSYCRDAPRDIPVWSSFNSRTLCPISRHHYVGDTVSGESYQSPYSIWSSATIHYLSSLNLNYGTQHVLRASSVGAGSFLILYLYYITFIVLCQALIR